jgi:hypothetical protein
VTSPTAERRLWSRAETLAAIHVYLLLPFGQLHRNQPLIKQLASWIDRSPSSVALKLVNLASLDPQIVDSGRVGMKNASAQDEKIWAELLAGWDHVALQAAGEYERLATANGVSPESDVAETLGAFEGNTRVATVELRVNQARFRKAVLASYNATCCISGLKHPKLVIASHIVPWSEDKQNRLNPQNGLCLSALHDRAYDQGLLTVMPDFTVRVSPDLYSQHDSAFGAAALLQFQGRPITMPERFRPCPAFLANHARRFGFL